MSEARQQTEIVVPAEAAAIFSDALDQYADSLSAFAVPPEETEWRLYATFSSGTDFQSLKNSLALAAQATGVAEPNLTLTPLVTTDWLAEISRQFPPLAVGRFFLHGSHIEPIRGDSRLRLHIDAGVAFGSGEHATTQGCLMALEDLARRHDFARVLDMGCGSGVLGFAAAKLWRAQVIAIDIDRDSVLVARENARLNQVERFVTASWGDGYKAPILARQKPFDLIVSNILAGPLRRMAPSLARSLKPGGYAILSGLLRWQEAGVLRAHQAQGLRLVKRFPIGEWQTLVLRKR